MITVFAAVYLTGFLGEKKKLVFGVLFAAASIALIIGTAALTDYTVTLVRLVEERQACRSRLQFSRWLCLTVLPLLAAWRFNPPSVVPVAVVL